MDPVSATLLPYALSTAALTLQGAIRGYMEDKHADNAANCENEYDKDNWNRIMDCHDLLTIIEPCVRRLLDLPAESSSSVPTEKVHGQPLLSFWDMIGKFVHRSQAFVKALSSAVRGPAASGPTAWTTYISVTFEHGVTLVQQYATIYQDVSTSPLLRAVSQALGLSNLEDAYHEVQARFAPIGQRKVLLRSAIEDVYLSVHNHLPNSGPAEYAIGTTLVVAAGIIGGSLYAGFRYIWTPREAELRVKPYANGKQEVKLSLAVAATSDDVAEKEVQLPDSTTSPSYDSSIVFTQADGRSRLPIELKIIHADPRYRGIPGHSRALRFNDRIILVRDNNAKLGRKKSGSSWVATFDPVGEIDCTWVVCPTL